MYVARQNRSCAASGVRAKSSAALAVAAVAVALGCGRPEGPSAPTITPDPLTISCPADVTTQAALSRANAVVTFAAPVVSGGILPIQTQCTPASGTTFPVGTTRVECRASDVTSAATCAFSVVVQPPPTPRLSVTTFLAFGDSLTEGKTSLAGSPWQLTLESAYTFKLLALLQERYTEQAITVLNEGLGGQEAGNPAELTRLERALDANRPDAVLLMEGANDLLNKGETAVPRIIDGLDAMVRRAQARGVRVVLASLPPQNPNGVRGRNAPIVPMLNDEIKSLAQSRAAAFVDLFAAFNGDLTLVGSDGLHLTSAGYETVARAFYDTIVETLEVRTTTSARR